MVVWLTPKDFKIMVVGDLESDRQLYSDYLSQSGFQVAGSSDTVECPERIKHLQPDLVVLDLWLSSPDSWDTVSLLKKDDRTMRIPLVIVTARSFVQAPKAGCDGI